jgi:hypothetical protein
VAHTAAATVEHRSIAEPPTQDGVNNSAVGAPSVQGFAAGYAGAYVVLQAGDSVDLPALLAVRDAFTRAAIPCVGVLYN